MTTFEYFKKQYDKNHDYMVECIHSNVPVDSFHFVEVAWKYCFGGTTEVDAWYNIKGVDDTQEMIAAGYVTKWDSRYCSRLVKHVSLTKKGLRAFYKAMLK